MLLHKDGLIELKYDVVLDILSLKWPDMSGMTLPEIEFSLQKLIDTLRHYDIKNLLIDSRESKTDLDNEEHLALMLRFSEYLTSTRLKKMARLATTDLNRENIVDYAVGETNNRLGITFEIRNFADEAGALKWLRENQN
ncbi:hypothetical protein JAO76_09065 [Pontibacter sp. BT310]|jgi:hypothetical protein|uniref:STAS/SEC14 domain-containing protein n=1 Tax=Pontibacter populi TaxID=890055 RepID=A0ABS6XCG7_9BACT|nr:MULTISPECIES: hypothetical protein [Pontibacter]MBJ6118340.1 hypothetical protein [Pontibacter sp. BT310]MBR0570767.1 hypothetical protein [Microvirga sp. STS03]MBW3365193.1 hypothetical protein [Pontibacter populi]